MQGISGSFIMTQKTGKRRTDECNRNPAPPLQYYLTPFHANELDAIFAGHTGHSFSSSFRSLTGRSCMLICARYLFQMPSERKWTCRNNNKSTAWLILLRCFTDFLWSAFRHINGWLQKVICLCFCEYVINKYQHWREILKREKLCWK